jgi:hypothetical protein
VYLGAVGLKHLNICETFATKSEGLWNRLKGNVHFLQGAKYEMDLLKTEHFFK